MDYKFCPKCGGEIKLEKPNMFKCQKCGFELYINPAPTNAAILENDKGEVLLIKRKWPPKEGMYDLPGGFIDIEETLEQSVRRELKEELNLDQVDLEYIGPTKPDRYLFQGINFHTICFLYKGKIKDQKIEPLDDVGELEWVAKDKIPYGKFAFESMEQAVRDYLK